MSKAAISALKTDGSVLKGTFYICISAAMFALAGTAVKFATSDLAPPLVVFWRNMLSFIVFASWIYLSGFRDFKTKLLNVHVMRSVFTVAALYCYFFAISRVDYASAMLLQWTSPIFLPFMAFLVFRYVSEFSVWIGVFAAFVGVVMIASTEFAAGTALSGDGLGYSVGLMSGFFGAAATISIWFMSSHEPPARQMMYFTAISVVLSLPLAVYFWEIPDRQTFIALLFLGCFTTLAHFFMIKGFSVAPADKVNTWTYLSVGFAALIGWWFWDELIGVLTMSGIAVVILGAVLASKVSKTEVMQDKG
jgi:drug/metabolite transporter (DMT)-like permease